MVERHPGSREASKARTADDEEREEEDQRTTGKTSENKPSSALPFRMLPHRLVAHSGQNSKDPQTRKRNCGKATHFEHDLAKSIWLGGS